MGTPVGKNPFDFANYQIGGAFANQSADISGWTAAQYRLHQSSAYGSDAGLGRGIQSAIQQPGTGMGQVRRRRDQPEHQVRHQHVARLGYEYLRNKIFNSNEFF